MLPQAITRGSTICKPPVVDTRAGLSYYEWQSVTSCGVPNTKHNSYSRHKISNITGHNLWLPNQVETIGTSHNLQTHTGYQYHQATTRDCHVFTFILSNNSRNVILNHNSRNSSTNSILQQIPCPLLYRLALPKLR